MNACPPKEADGPEAAAARSATGRPATGAQATGRPVTGTVPAVLERARQESGTPQQFYRAAIHALAAHFDAPYAAVQIERSATRFLEQAGTSKAQESTWGRLCEGLLLSACYKNVAVAKLYDVPGAPQQLAAMAVPLSEGPGGSNGALAVVTPCPHKAVAEARLAELSSLCSVVSMLAASFDRAQAAPPSVSSPSAAGIAKAASYENLHEFAFAFANQLKTKLGCEQVCLGLVRRRRVRTLCVSGLDNLYPRSPGTLIIEQAMEECLDAGHPVCFQQDEPSAGASCSTGHRLHKRWHSETGASAVASIPLKVEDRCVAILAIRAAAGKWFHQDDLPKIQEAAQPMASGMVLLDKATQGVLTHAGRNVRVSAARWLGAGRWGRKFVAVAVLAVLGWLVTGTRTHVVSIPCELTTRDTRQIAAPFEGVIREVHVTPGDQVVAGQPLLDFDTRDLFVEQEKLLAQLSIAEVALARAVGEKDLTKAALAQAEHNVARAELRAVNSRLQRAQVLAPQDGLILSGDLKPRIGSVVPLGEPLLEFAPEGRWTAELHVPEYAAAYLAAGQTGQLALQARPELHHSCHIDQIPPATEVVGGKNVFVVEADVDGTLPGWTRDGMRGVALIDAGERRIWWVGLHRLIDTLRLQWWKL